MLHRVAEYALVTCLFVFCGFMTVFGQSAQPENAAKEAVGRAQAAYVNKDYALARRELEGALAIKPDWAEAHLLLGMVARQEGKVDDAIKSAQDAIKYRPNYPDAHYVMGKLYFEKRKWTLADEEANLVLGQDAKFPGVYALLGDIALAQSQYESAVNFYEQALAQPSLNGAEANGTRIKIEAVKNYLEFKENLKNKDYQLPKFVTEAQTGKGMKPLTYRKGWVVLKGVCTEQGWYTSYIYYSTDDQTAETFLQRMTQNQHTPAKKKGVPVPLWVIMEYKHRED